MRNVEQTNVMAELANEFFATILQPWAVWTWANPFVRAYSTGGTVEQCFAAAGLIDRMPASVQVGPNTEAIGPMANLLAEFALEAAHG
jgi:hypothetical protein